MLGALVETLHVVCICVGKQQSILRKRWTFLHYDEDVEAMQQISASHSENLWWFPEKASYYFPCHRSKLSSQNCSDKVKKFHTIEINKDFSPFGILYSPWGRTTRQLNCGLWRAMRNMVNLLWTWDGRSWGTGHSHYWKFIASFQRIFNILLIPKITLTCGSAHWHHC